jgi:hypothetical protein
MVEVDEADLREIALAGSADAASTDRIAQGLFLSNAVKGEKLAGGVSNAVALTRRNAVAFTATPLQSPGPSRRRQ